MIPKSKAARDAATSQAAGRVEDSSFLPSHGITAKPQLSTRNFMKGKYQDEEKSCN